MPSEGAPFILGPSTPITCDMEIGKAMDPLAAWFMRELARQFPDLAADAPVNDPFVPDTIPGEQSLAIRLVLVPDIDDPASMRMVEPMTAPPSA